MGETMIISETDVGTISAEELGLKPVATGPKVKLTEAGNAILVCKTCKAEVDKGCPPIPGQNDDTFVCGPCHDEVNAKALAEQVEAAGGPVVLK